MATISKPVADLAKFLHNTATLQKIFMPGVHDFVVQQLVCAHEKNNLSPIRGHAYKGTFHLSELTGKTISLVMKISLLIKTI